MIWAFKLNRASAFSCDTDAEFFQHIMSIENAKLLEDSPEFGNTFWSFTHYTPQRVALLFINSKKGTCSPVLTQAYEKNLGLIEICTGSFEKPVEVVVTPDVNINKLKKEWCLDYCQAHNYEVVDTGVQSAEAAAANGIMSGVFHSNATLSSSLSDPSEGKGKPANNQRITLN
jgi:hypothetical protein